MEDGEGEPETDLPQEKGTGTEQGPEGVGRRRWSRKREYILSLLGYSVGLGSLWRFPYLCNRNGGGAFLIPYFLGIFTCSLPIFFLEASIGQFSSRSAMHVWEMCPLFSGIGIAQIIVSFFGTIPYNVIISWSIYYLVQAFHSVLPWTTCENWWNTPLCVNHLGNSTSLNTSIFSHAVSDQRLADSSWRKSNVTITASEEFWQYNTLGISSGLSDVGRVQSHLVLCVLAGWVVVFLCLMKGVQSVGKVVYVSATLPYLLLTVLLVRSCMMPGAANGLVYFLKPNLSKLASVQVWLEALLQGFYSVSATFGGLITMSSYNKFHNNCLKDVLFVTIVGELSSVFCGLVVFSTLGFMAFQADLPVSQVVSSGSGLGFIIYPEAISRLPLPQLWAVLFFLVLFSIGIDSTFANVETSVSGICEMFPSYLYPRRVVVTGCVCFISFLLSLPYTTEGGIYLFQLLEWYFVSFSTLLVGCLECIAINWLYGSERFCGDVELMIGRRPPAVLRLCTTYLTPLILFAALVLSLFMYDPPRYGEYFYPEYAKALGILMTVLLALPIPVCLLYQLASTHGTLRQRLRRAIQPSSRWRPLQPEDRREYLATRRMDDRALQVQLMPSSSSPGVHVPS